MFEQIDKKIFTIIHSKLCLFRPTVNVLKFRTLFFFQSQINCWFSGLEFTKGLSEWQTGKILIRLLQQTDLGVHCLSRPFFAGN